VHEARKKKSGMGTSPNAAAASGKTGAGMSGAESRMSAPAGSKTGAGAAAPAAGKTGAGKATQERGTGADTRANAPSVSSNAAAAPGSPQSGSAQPANDNKPSTFSKTPSTGRVAKPVSAQETPDGGNPSSKRARGQS